MPAEGQLLPIAQYSTLFSLIGTTYGGDGIINFALPDLRAVTPQSTSGAPLIYSICIDGFYPARN
jgi:microcystin-dependent protein